MPAALQDMSDEDLDFLLSQHDAGQNQLQGLSDEELARQQADAARAADTTVVSPLVITAPGRPTGGAKNVGRARAIGQGLFSLGDEAEAGIRWLGGAPYKKSLEDIRHQYEIYKRYNPVEAGAIELGTGIASAFIPGVGLAGKGFEAATGAARLAPLARVALTGAAEGALSGAGAGETAEGRTGGALMGAVTGAGGGALLHGLGRGVNWGREALQALRSPGSDAAVSKADQIIADVVQRTGLTPDQIMERMRLDRQYGIPSTFGQSGDELMRLTEAAVYRPSAGRGELVEKLVGQQAGSRGRVANTIQTASPSPDYFATQEGVMTGLRSRAKTAYDAAYAAGDVNDPQLNAFLNTPEGKALFGDAQKLASADKAGAVLRGEDPEQYNLRPVFNAVRDAEGNVVDFTPTGDVVPDVRTLDYMKKAMDARITGGFKSSNAADISMAHSLKDIRNSFVERLDNLVPAYRAARDQYKGDIEIADALEMGRNNVPKMRWQEFQKSWNKMSVGEREAVRTGTMQRLLEPIEDSPGERNFAQNIVGSESWRRKLSTMLPRDQYDVLEASLKREAELRGKTTRALAGSPTTGRLASIADIDRLIAGGDVEGAAELLTNPRSWVRAAASVLLKAKDLNLAEGTYSAIARSLAEDDPVKVGEMFARILASAPARQAASDVRTGLEQRVAGGVAAASGAPPSPEDVEEPPTTFVMPTLDIEEDPNLSLGGQ
jgi:hypothetical protein